MPRHPCQDKPLILSGLIVTADPQVDRRPNASGVHSSSSELYQNDSTDPRFVEQFVRWISCAGDFGDGDIATGQIVSPTMAGLIPRRPMTPHSQWKPIHALSPWYCNNLKLDDFEMERCVRKKSL